MREELSLAEEKVTDHSLVLFSNHIALQIFNAFDLNPVYSRQSLNASGQKQKSLSTKQQQGGFDSQHECLH